MARDDSSFGPLAQSSSATTLSMSHWQRWRIVYLYGLFMLISTFGDNINRAPEVRLYELLVCRRYYLKHDPSMIDPHGDIPEESCKLDALQGELSMLRGWLFFWLLLASMLVAIPFGVLADSLGRKVVVAISLLSITLTKCWIVIVCTFWATFPPQAIWLSAIFRLFGGGYSVLGAVVMAAVADAVPEHRRTTILFQISTITLISEMTAGPLGSLIMVSVGPLLTAMISTFVEFSSILVLVFVPQTLQRETIKYAILPATNDSEERNEEELSTARGLSKTSLESVKLILQKIEELPHDIRQAANLTLQEPKILFCVPSFLIPTMGKELVFLLLQYISVRYKWTIASANVLMTIRPVTNIILYTLLLPALNRALRHALHLAVGYSDLITAQISAVISIFGLLLIGLSPSVFLLAIALTLFSLGWGYDISTQLYLTSLVPKEDIAFLYTLTGAISAIGGILGAPLFAALFSVGLEWNGSWVGLPFFVGAGIYILCSVGILKVKEKNTRAVNHANDCTNVDE